jgi:hypothetical protein
VTIHASTENPLAKCPGCGYYSSRRIHSVYRRTLADLPWCGTPVRLRLRVRKFFCDGTSCSQRIFAERLEEVARTYARRTDRQREALEWIAPALGREAGARLAPELGLFVSPDTLLHRIREISFADGDDKAVRVLGVDDFVLSREARPAAPYSSISSVTVVPTKPWSGCMGSLHQPSRSSPTPFAYVSRWDRETQQLVHRPTSIAKTCRFGGGVLNPPPSGRLVGSALPYAGFDASNRRCSSQPTTSLLREGAADALRLGYAVPAEPAAPEMLR